MNKVVKPLLERQYIHFCHTKYFYIFDVNLLTNNVKYDIIKINQGEKGNERI